MQHIDNIKQKMEKSPPRFIAMGFFMVIFLGAILLSMPISSRSGSFTNFLDAFFTSTSAVCVTGLATLNTAGHWSIFGKIVILSLIEIGGLGFMTWAILIALAMKKKITLRDRLVISEQLNTFNIQGMVKLIIYVIKATLLIELVGAIFLSIKFIPDYGFLRGTWFSIFHSISAYCNAGFDLIGESSLKPYAGSPIIVFTITSLIIVGGLGFNVIMDIQNKKSLKKLTCHSKLVLFMTITLILLGFVVFYILEKDNPLTFQGLSIKDKLLRAYFQSVTTRTAGFSTVNQIDLREPSAVFTIILMFIGGSPAGTAGGIKTTTLGILLLTTWAEIKSSTDVSIFGRKIVSSTIRKALAIIIISLIWIMAVTFILTITESHSFINLFFETMSAFGTVGVTRDITNNLSSVGKVLIMTTMYLGRLGPLTLAFAFTKKTKQKKFAEPKGDILVG